MKGLTKSQAAAITASLYNPNFTHNAVFVNIAKLAMRQVFESVEDILPWTSKINPALHPVYVKVMKLFLGEPCYCLIHVPFN